MTAALYRRSLFHEIGPLDERFVSYMRGLFVRGGGGHHKTLMTTGSLIFMPGRYTR